MEILNYLLFAQIITIILIVAIIIEIYLLGGK